MIDATHWMRQHVLAAGSIGLSGWFRNAASGAGTLDVHYELYTRRGEPVVRVIYCPQQEGQPVEHDIGLQTTCPYRGGVRWWFMCPLQRKGRPCGRRVQKLYLPPNALRFGCRDYYDVSYLSRRQNAKVRACRKVFRIRKRLGGSGLPAENFPERPRRMWRRTYDRLRKQAEEAEAKILRTRRPSVA